VQQNERKTNCSLPRTPDVMPQLHTRTHNFVQFPKREYAIVISAAISAEGAVMELLIERCIASKMCAHSHKHQCVAVYIGVLILHIGLTKFAIAVFAAQRRALEKGKDRMGDWFAGFCNPQKGGGGTCVYLSASVTLCFCVHVFNFDVPMYILGICHIGVREGMYGREEAIEPARESSKIHKSLCTLIGRTSTYSYISATPQSYVCLNIVLVCFCSRVRVRAFCICIL